MKVTFYALMLIISLTLSGCGNGGGGGGGDVVTTPEFDTKIVSDPNFDGDIERDPFSNVVTITQGNNIQSVFAGIDPNTNSETRAFLDFPLTGAGGIPGNAVITSATLDIAIKSIFPKSFSGTLPMRIDLVSLQPPTLFATDFNRTLLISTTIQIFPSDFGNHVRVDVTSLMEEAQRRGLLDFQVRILVAPPGLIEINDTTGVNRGLQAPLLEVTYF